VPKRGKKLREAKRLVAMANNRRIVARLISTRQPISLVQACMVGVNVSPRKIGYRLDPNPLSYYLVPIEPPETKEQLTLEIVGNLLDCALEARSIPKRNYKKITHNCRLIKRMGRQ
jgi:hypothetical protein